MAVTQHAPVDTQDHRTRQFHQRRARRFLVPLQKPFQRFPIGQSVELPRIGALAE
jgi:hypothetical protein